MGKYKIGVKESYYSVFEVDSDSYQEAIDKIEDKIDKGEIILDDTSSYKRSYVNDNSKLLVEQINLKVSYNPEKNSITISDGKNSADYFGFEVPDIIKSFTYFCNTFIEEHEITEEQLNEKELGGVYE